MIVDHVRTGARMRSSKLSKLEAELRRVEDAITNLYWTYTRTARGKPPCIVRPDLYVRRRELNAEIRAIKFPRAA